MPRLLLLLICLLTAAAPLHAESRRHPVSLQLKWYHQFQFAGYYAALEKGYYREAGLDVTLREGDPQRDPIHDVVSGKADFGIGASELVIARAEGKPVVALAVILQHSPLIVLAKQGATMHSFHDLIGKSIRVVPHEYELNAMFHAMGHDSSDFNLTARTVNDIEDLATESITAISAYSTDEPYFLEKRNIPMLQFTPRAVGVDFYGDTLFTSDRMVQQSPSMVEAFRQASIKGWHYALANPEEIAELIVRKYAPGKDRDQLLWEARQMRTLMMPEMVDIGYMSEGRWRHIRDTYAELHLLAGNISLDDFIYDPHPYRDLSWLYLAMASGFSGALLFGAIGIYILRLNRKLSASERNYRMLAENAFDVIMTYHLGQHRFTYVSPAVERMRGYSASEVMAQSLAETLTPNSLSLVEEAIAQLLQSGELPSHYWEVEQLCKDGSTVWTEVSLTVVRDEQGKPEELLGIAHNITEQRKLREELLSRSVAIEAAAESVVITDRDGIIQYVNPAFTRMTGYSREEAIGHKPNIVKSGLHNVEFYRQLWSTILAGNIWRGEISNRSKSGELYIESAAISPVVNNRGEILHFVAIKHDITTRKRLEEKLDHMAHFDMLTEVPNRQLFFLHMIQALAHASQHEQQLALLFIDLDGFKAINDTLGHEAGDVVLQSVAERLRGSLREADMVARVGGDEFAVLLDNIKSTDYLQPIIGKLLTAIGQPIDYKGDHCYVGASIGVSLFPLHGQDAETLFSLADTAMYSSKRAGKNRWTLYHA